MQTLDVISVNLWQILISLINLALLFLVIKKFLFQPVKNMLEKRQKELDAQYEAAATAQAQADESRRCWEETLSGARGEADAILQTATEQAKGRADKLIAEAKESADGIVRNARSEAELERQKAADGMKREIVAVSGALAEKMLEREINTDDHRALIDSFIKEMGDGND
jgi:F-type H+-transporting ATPase subunit b